eukprot:g953.t1
MAALVCSGLLNREDDQNSTRLRVYTLKDKARDMFWFNETMMQQDSPPLNVIQVPSVSVLLSAYCLPDSAISHKYIRYNASSQQAILPNIVTLAGVLDAVPLEDSDIEAFKLGARDGSGGGSGIMVFDALETFEGFDALEATRFVFQHYGNRTNPSSWAKTNPGLDVHGGHPLNPPLVPGSADLFLTDFIVKNRIFTFFLNNGCIPFTSEHALVESMVNSGLWTTPITVFGYDDTYAIAGDLFEAETDCVKEHAMGQVASNGCNNLAFFQSRDNDNEPVASASVTTTPTATYNASKTYVGIVIGDGDNVNFIKGSRADWMRERLGKCTNATTCPPLIWTLSPALREIAPAWAKWFFDQASKTNGSDTFSLPPSGHTYSYPGEMRDDDQARFVDATEEDCLAYGTSVTVDWEFALHWSNAVRSFYPKYTKRGVVRGIVPVQVPYMLPIAPLLLTKYHNFDVINNSLVVFKPNEWRGGRGGNPKIPGDHDRNLPAADMAAKISAYRQGTVEAIYVTSDGGANLDLIYDMIGLLEDHVELVGSEALVEMALQAARQSDSA